MGEELAASLRKLGEEFRGFIGGPSDPTVMDPEACRRDRQVWGTGSGYDGIGLDDQEEERGMGTPEIDLNALAEGLPASEVAEVADFIAWKKARRESLMNSARAWHGSLPAEDEEITSEEEDAAKAAKAEPGSIPWEQVKAELGL